MAKKSYYELLKDPRWQKKRLEIMERDGFACRECYADDLALNVHHLCYRKGADGPWDYDDEILVTLCEQCHRAYEKARSEMQREFGSLRLHLQTAVIWFAILVRRKVRDGQHDDHDIIRAVVTEMGATDLVEKMLEIDKYCDQFRGQELLDDIPCDPPQEAGPACVAPKDPDMECQKLKPSARESLNAMAELCATSSEPAIVKHICKKTGFSSNKARGHLSFFKAAGLVFKAESGEYFLHPKTAVELDSLNSAS